MEKLKSSLVKHLEKAVNWRELLYVSSWVSAHVPNFKGSLLQLSYKHGIYILGKCPCGPKSRIMFKHPWVLTWDTTVYLYNIYRIIIIYRLLPVLARRPRVDIRRSRRHYRRTRGRPCSRVESPGQKGER